MMQQRRATVKAARKKTRVLDRPSRAWGDAPQYALTSAGGGAGSSGTIGARPPRDETRRLPENLHGRLRVLHS
jgi:hypothetical protein